MIVWYSKLWVAESIFFVWSLLVVFMHVANDADVFLFNSIPYLLRKDTMECAFPNCMHKGSCGIQNETCSL